MTMPLLRWGDKATSGARPYLVRRGRIELPRIAPLVPETSASAVSPPAQKTSMQRAYRSAPWGPREPYLSCPSASARSGNVGHDPTLRPFVPALHRIGAAREDRTPGILLTKEAVCHWPIATLASGDRAAGMCSTAALRCRAMHTYRRIGHHHWAAQSPEL